jgi:hypothetical protein
MQILPSPMGVEGSLPNDHHRGSEGIHPIPRLSIEDAHGIEAPSCVPPVKDTHKPLVPKAQLLPSQLESPSLPLLIEDFYIRLSKIERVLHDRRIGIRLKS